MGKLKPDWQKTDMPKHIKIELWRAMNDNTTLTSWQQAIANMHFVKSDDKYVKTSYDTYTSLKKEVKLMPLEEVETLPQNLQQWIFQLRPDLLAGQQTKQLKSQAQDKAYEETTHKRKMRDLAGKVASAIALPPVFDIFMVELKPGSIFLGRDGLPVNISETGQPKVGFEFVGHLYEGLRSHLDTGGFSEVLSGIDSWKGGVVSNLLACHKLLTMVKGEVEESYQATIPIEYQGQSGFTPWFLITICGDAIEQARGVTYITDSWYKYEGSDLGCGAFLIYKGVPDENLDVYRNTHVALRAKYAAHEEVKEIAEQRVKLYQIQGKIRQQLQKFIDMEHVLGQCELCSHSSL